MACKLILDTVNEALCSSDGRSRRVACQINCTSSTPYSLGRLTQLRAALCHGLIVSRLYPMKGLHEGKSSDGHSMAEAHI